MILTENCGPHVVALFLDNELKLDQKLEFLEHLEECPQCWGEIYKARKNEHPHYYKKTSRRLKVTEKELAKLNGVSAEENERESSYQMA